MEGYDISETWAQTGRLGGGRVASCWGEWALFLPIILGTLPFPRARVGECIGKSVLERHSSGALGTRQTGHLTKTGRGGARGSRECQVPSWEVGWTLSLLSREGCKTCYDDGARIE